MARLLIAALVAWAVTWPVRAQNARPLPDRASFFKATQDNLARAQREQWRYAYKERRTELHANPFGRIGTDDDVKVYEVTPGSSPGVIYRTLREKNGAKVTDAKPERQDRRERERQPSRPTLDDVVDTLTFVMHSREVRDGRDTIAVTFAARPNARPQTREGRLAKIFTGTIWVDEAAREVARVEAVTVDTMSFGFGMIARLNEGTQVTLTREPVGDIWLPTAVRFLGEGRAMLFRKLNVDFAVDWFDYRKVAG